MRVFLVRGCIFKSPDYHTFKFPASFGIINAFISTLLVILFYVYYSRTSLTYDRWSPF